MSGGSCAGQGAHKVLKALRASDAVRSGEVEVRESVCLGYCGEGPNVKVMGGAFHNGVTPDCVEHLIEEARDVLDDVSDEVAGEDA